MKLSRVLVLSAVLSAFLAVDGRAADPTKEEIAKQEKKATAISELAMAADLAVFGRDVKSPESLVLAAGMLLRANGEFAGKSEPLDSKATDDKGTAITSETLKVPALDKQAEALFDEARAMVTGNTVKSAAIEALIKEAKSFPARGLVGGPRVISRVLQPGETHTYPVTYVGGMPAAVTMTSSGPPKIQFDIVHVSGNNVFSLRGQNAGYNWVPVRDADGLRRFRITLTNVGRNPTTYVLTSN